MLVSFVHREFGRRQVNPALQLIDTSTSPPCEPCHCARAVRGACSFDYIELRPPSGTLSTFSPGILPPAGKSRLPNSNQRGSYEPHELLSSSRTRRAAALNSSAERHTKRFFTGDFAAARQKLPSILKAAPPPASPAVQLVDGAPRSGAYSFEYIEIVPASETSVIHGGFCRRQAKAAPPNSKRRHHELRCSSRRRECAEYIDFHLPSKLSHFKSHPSRIPGVFGNSIFRRPASDVGEMDEPKSPSPRLRRFSKANIKIGNSRFRRPPNANFMRGRVQFAFQIRFFEFP
ncbi:hypothetical protein R3P38DRAFT_3611877 [Favolaschia claudopus]|uniref:Uncharacterized protein n=1 Tax=Favolaschia claudopus TaxID=2862362 RepID=A0AAW0A744_9AGAR